MLAITPVELNYMDTLAKIFIIPGRKKPVHSGKHCNNAPVRQTAIAAKMNSAFTISYTKNLFWYQQINPGLTRKLRGGQTIVNFDAADICCFNVTTRKALNS